ncbi:hypothetical protein VFPFJ_00343 [Purpureocillium lilacinum]|nr:hypothetical protein VFPFJ_00343 [Purpureocillium lilacinum]OAQ86274.1 hypothetical protein VFPBJ_00314 [Purpureocillium lilacinum]OAQ94234.1 hypothetical protein VFPFJ_00343 [Purpureocillium lilacinum]GJN67470.1 hypothetical protein PLICBS_001496 [Purpureocillium lilacinum]GJN81377.1 hypothetical protein PLIIFM63780_004911 [Purpureocillium lilacinum]
MAPAGCLPVAGLGCKKSNKKRLYVALYPSGVVGNEERRYHWALIMSPKVEEKDGHPAEGTRFHVKNPPGSAWIYEEQPLPDPRVSANLLVRVLIAKVENEGRLRTLIRSTTLTGIASASAPVQHSAASGVLDHNYRPSCSSDGFRCRTWVADVFERLHADSREQLEVNGRSGALLSIGTAVSDWRDVEDTARLYAARKAAEGRFESVELSIRPKPTWDMLKNKEVIE